MLAAMTGTTVAVAAPGGNATLNAKSDAKIVINKYEQDLSHWAPGTVTVGSGRTLTIKADQGPPHTFSVVKSSQLPKTTFQIFECSLCEKINGDHGFGQGPGPPKKPVIDVGAAGIDQAGDSVVLQPGKSTRLKVSAKKGTTLRFFCTIHPWMQGKLQVR